jgi:hypothetical protein
MFARVARVAAEPHYLLGRFHTVRAAYARTQQLRGFVSPDRELRISEHFGTDFRPLAVAPSELVESSFDARTHTGNLQRDSYSPGLRLAPRAIEHFVQLAHTLPLEENGRPLPPLDTVRNTLAQRVAIATVKGPSYDALIQALVGDPLLVDVVSSYLGYRPRYASPWLFWSFANGLSEAEREARYQTVKFHYDVHSYNFMYVNFYLLETDERTGAHALVRGSHRHKKWRHLLGSAKLSDDQALRDYSADRVVVVSGPAGTGFFEDTSCYHKALAPLDRERLMLQIRYL